MAKRAIPAIKKYVVTLKVQKFLLVDRFREVGKG